MRIERKTTWILIADGARAHIVATEGPKAGLQPVGGQGYSAEHRKTSEIGADRPGRVHDRRGVGRHAMAPRVDWHEYEKTLFAKRMAAILDMACKRDSFDALVLIAPPRSLGELRAALDKRTLNKVTAEVGKDLTHLSLHELPGHLKEVVRF